MFPKAIALLLVATEAFGQRATDAPTLVISEVMSSNRGYVLGDGTTPDWLELTNTGSQWLSLEGWRVSDDCQFDDAYVLPGGIGNVPPDGGKVLLLADGSSRVVNNFAYTDFRLSSSGETVCLYAPDGQLVDEIKIPPLSADQSYGRVADGSELAVLARPTPGERNSEAAPTPTYDLEAVHPGVVQPGESFKVEVLSKIPVRGVDMVYEVDRGQPTRVGMQATGEGYEATVPGAVVTAGSMIRWYFEVTDESGQTHRFPAFNEPWAREYYGTFVDDPSLATSLPVVWISCVNEKDPFTLDKEMEPGCSVMLHGQFYDNVIVRRRGMSSQSWPVPKMKIDAGNQGKIFLLDPDSDNRVKEFGMNSEHGEPGENSLMRETVTWRALEEMGVPSLDFYQTQARFNGEYFGKFSLGDEWDVDTLKEAGFGVTGYLMKSLSGDKSNLRWDIDPWTSKYYYRASTIDSDEAFIALGELTKGLAGGGTCGSRSAWVYDNIDLPRSVNYAAAMALLLNQDRCTKNFLVYWDPTTELWTILPHDVEAAIASDRGLGGRPAPDYAILADEQWNSPLACSRGFPQDVLVNTPWALISTDVNPDRAARRMLQQQAPYPGWNPSIAANGAAAPGLELDSRSSISPGWDGDQRSLPIPEGVEATYNFLLDALLSIPSTRSMVMTRLRSLMEEFLLADGSGRLRELIIDEYGVIEEEAVRHQEFWGASFSAERGFQQLLTEVLPIRADQLWNTYSSSGEIPLIPDAPPVGATVEVEDVDLAGGVVVLKNNNDFAVDLSGRSLTGTNGDVFDFEPGTVLPAGMTLFVASDPVAFRKRLAAERGGCSGEFVIGGFSADDLTGDVALSA